MKDNAVTQNQTGLKSTKIEQRLTRLKAINNAINDGQSIAFRLLALLFVIGVEITFFVILFKEIKVDGAVITAMTIIAILPILVMRAFDISALSLTKEGLSSEMIQAERQTAEALITGDLISGPAASIKFGNVISEAPVTITTGKFLLIECDGKQLKLPVVE